MIVRLIIYRLLRNISEDEKEIEVPELAYEYARGIAEATGLSLKEVLMSRPVRRYIERMEKRVRVRLGD